MKTIILTFALMASMAASGQNDSSWFKAGLKDSKEFIAMAENSNTGRWKIAPRLKEIDTVRCLFLEIVDTTNTQVKWVKGYVIRTNETIIFGKTRVSSNYLPITSGIITSPLFYEDKKSVLSQCIQLIILK